MLVLNTPVFSRWCVVQAGPGKCVASRCSNANRQGQKGPTKLHCKAHKSRSAEAGGYAMKV